MSDVKGGDLLFPNTNSESRQQANTHAHTNRCEHTSKIHCMRNFLAIQSNANKSYVIDFMLLLMSVQSSSGEIIYIYIYTHTSMPLDKHRVLAVR